MRRSDGTATPVGANLVFARPRRRKIYRSNKSFDIVGSVSERILAIRRPALRVGENVLAYGIKTAIVSDDVFVIVGLPKMFVEPRPIARFNAPDVCVGRNRFECLNHAPERVGSGTVGAKLVFALFAVGAAKRAKISFAPTACAIESNNSVDVIGHHRELIQDDRRKAV